MNRPLCFVLMPIGKKPDSAGALVDFDAVYRDLIAPAIEAAGLEALRADEEMAGGSIHTPTSERLILCQYAVADLTSAGANVVYELGRRHAEHPSTTVFVFAAGRRLPFDVAPLRALPYQLTPEGTPKDVETVKAALVSRLLEAHQAAAEHAQTATGSSIYQLVENYHDIAHTKTDVFRDRVRYSAEIKQRLTVARRQGVEAVERRIAPGTPDYWDHATRLELAVLAKDEQGALAALADALAAVREPWEPETTARNLRLIREARERRHEAITWAKPIEDELARRAKGEGIATNR